MNRSRLLASPYRTVLLWVLIAAVGIGVAKQLRLPERFLALGAQGPGPCDPPNGNPVVCENQNPGTPAAQWDIDGAGDASIQGFATDISFNRGTTVSFKIDTNASHYNIDIYRMGYYGGMGARKITSVTPSATLPQNQPDCLTDDATGLIDCGNWAVSASWPIPATATSGIYFAKLTRIDTGGSSHIMFIVRDDSSRSDMFFQTSDTTWQAYNTYGGNSLYVGGPGQNPGRAYKVSYNRPFVTRDPGAGTTHDWVFNAEYPMVRFLEANGYNVSYTTGVDSDRRGALIQQHKVFLSVGHDEYWSGNQRTNVEAARNAGVSMAFFSGNEVFWKTRWESAISADGTQYRTLVSYKETHANSKIDPAGPTVWTGTWADPRFSPPADGGKPQNGLTGTLFTVNCCQDTITVPAADGQMRLWRNTPVGNQTPGAVATLTPGTLGYEWDSDVDNGFRPAGLFRMSSTILTESGVLLDWGSTYGTGVAEHSLTMYRHASGALVFGAGTVQWSWGLDSNHDLGNDVASASMQQATINLFADMGVQPLTVQSGLATAAPSTDTLAPTSAFTAPAPGSSVPANQTVTISGTATDSGGGHVAAVEVSTDGGTTWHPATGRANWTFAWQTGAPRNTSLLSRAIDDSGNIGQATSAPYVVGGTTSNCPCSLWTPTQGPSSSPQDDPSALELGTSFTSDVSGFVTAVRFFKSPNDAGPHTGSVWTAAGAKLGTVTFTNETASGWQQANLTSPVAITANSVYVVSYHTDSGNYYADDQYFSQSVNNFPLHAPQDGTTAANGVYQYGSSAFPNNTYGSDNYWADVVFVTTAGPDTVPPQVTSAQPAANAINIATTASASVGFNESMSGSSISGTTVELRNSSNTLIASTVTYDAGSWTATIKSNAALAFSTTYTVRVHGGASGVKDAAGNALVADYIWSFSTVDPPPPPPTTGPGGPILVVSTTTNPFSQYYAEILRAEGLNAFAVMDLTTVTSTVLNSYDVVILGDMALSTTQVTMFSNWVTGGGNLIAMHPDKKLASLLGLTDAAATLSDAYIQVNTAAAPGAGIVGQTMQYHGPADKYTATGANTVATLYSNAVTATASPALTIRSVGSVGGQAAAFTYDLAKSIVYTRQGNPAWSGLHRDGQATMRSDDLYFGGTVANYVDLNKVAIPQADEQQRLLANLIGFLNADRKPLPRFWYFPRGFKAVVVMTGDDHANGGTAGRFDIYNSDSAVGCSVADWDCVRGTSYIFPNTPISAAQVATYVSQGFEIGAHMWMSGDNNGSTDASMTCNDFTPTSIAADYSQQIGLIGSLFPATIPQRTNRTHCIVWSDYDTQPVVALANGIRFDTNYYYWPDTWVNDVPGVFTGSGMPMRFAKRDGTMVDVYQATSQMTDESGQSFPMTIDTLLDRALGPEGYYGAFVANMHTDAAVHPGSEAIVASAQTRGVPIVSAAQMLEWLDGRNNSSFGNMTWAGSVLSFTVKAASGSRNLQAMLPATFNGSSLSALTQGSTPIGYSIQAIKGVNYAVFSVTAGSYQASYAVDTTPPVISAVAAAAAADTATITWATNEAATSQVTYGVSPNALNKTAVTPGSSTSHSVQLVGLASSTPYYYRVVSADVSGNTATSPASPNAPATFTTSSPPNLNCPCTIWTNSQSPTQSAVADSAAVELGLKFRPTFDGFITGVRFYKSPQNTGSHVGNLWTAGGALLGTVTFANESASGWQQALFSRPVPVTANTNYVVSYHTTTGFYAGDTQYFESAGITQGPLQALANGVAGPNGVYSYGPGGFPSSTFDSTNYWVDVVFDNNIVVDITAPTVVATVPPAGATGVSAIAPLSATFSESMDPSTLNSLSFTLRDAGNVLVPASVSYSTTTQTETLVPTGGLNNSATYTVRIATGPSGAQDLAGNPIPADVVWTFTTSAAPPFSVTDTTTSDFSAGTLDAGTYVAETTGGEVTLAPAVGAEFSGTTVPTGWSVTNWTANGSTVVTGGQVFTDSARVSLDAMLAPGQSIEFVATFSNDTFEHVGLGITFSETPWAMFSTAGGGGLYARTNDGVTSVDTLIPGNWLGTPHRYRIDWTATAITYWVDGVSVATHAAAIGGGMHPILSDYNAGGGNLSVDWLRATPYAASGTFVSRVIDAGTPVAWNLATWTASVPAGTSLAVSARFGNSPTPDGTWTAFASLPATGTPLSQNSRYVQYRAALAGIGAASPTLLDITFGAPSLPAPTISVGDVSIVEGNTGTVNAIFPVTLSHSAMTQVSVAYATADGTATANSDYVATASTAIFAPGTTVVNVSVPIIGDANTEPNETFFLNLSNPINATIADAQGVGTIVNDDVATLSIGNTSVTETDNGSVAAQFPVTLAAPSYQTVSVSYATASGTATAGTDFTTTSGTLTFAPGVTSQLISVPVLGDTLNEANETFTVNLTSPINAVVATAQGVGTIIDNDPLPSLVINNVSVTEGNFGTVNATFTVTLSRASGQTVTVSYGSSDATATAGTDYTATSGSLSFTPGVTSRTITVPVLGDTLDEANETFNVTLTSPVNATIATAQGVGTIIDDDLTPSLAINNVSVTEGNSGTVNAVFTVTLSAASGRTVTVNYATANSSATSPADYTAVSGTLTFAAGTTSQQVTVVVKGDTLSEGNETFNVNLSSATNATIADSQGTGTIVDDDPLPSVTIADASVTEGNFGTKTLTFTLTLSTASGRSTSVNYATSNGTAIAGSDYVAKSGTVTFAAGTTTQTLTVTINGDTTRESNETFFVNLSGASNLTIARTQATGTILNDD